MTQAEALQTLPELFQFWLQDQINACIQGHASRIERLEERIESLNIHIDADLAKIEDLSRALNEQNEVIRKLKVSELDYDDIWYEIKDRVEESVTDKFDEDFKDAVKEIIEDLDFSVSVS